MKTRFKYWNLAELVPIAIGVVLLSFALGYTKSKHREFKLSTVCNNAIVTNVCEH